MAKTEKKSLVIVESPAKAKTINKYLGSKYEVMASMGHIRDLPSKGINVDIDNDFEPTYEISAGRKRLVSQLKSAAKKCDKLFLATDLDREGEAIAWHLAEILDVPEDKTWRVVFNAITKSSIQQAFSKPDKLNQSKVDAQQARRILDRIVGYQISPLLWKRVAGGLSAGRVQSVAVKIVVEREKEIRGFKPDEYWQMPAVFSTDLQNNYSQEWNKFLNSGDKEPTVVLQNDWLTKHNAFKAELTSFNGKKFSVDNEKQALEIFNAIKEADYVVGNVDKKETSSRPAPPFITSTLQQAAANKIGFTAKRTMRTAQSLYEGIELGSMGAVGLITYMRTDSTNVSPEAISSARKYITESLGDAYLPAKPNYYSSKKNAQEAHEAIRPTDATITPQSIRQYLKDDEYKLYDLVWRRFVASQMTPAKWFITIAEIITKPATAKAVFKASGRVLSFDGFTKIWQTKSNEQDLPDLAVAQPVATVDIKPEQHFTKPPARYTEASLVKALEKEGIGRPSTYASIISTIQDREYVKQQDKKFYATDLGEVVTEKLEQFFPEIMDIAFTRDMELELDEIEEKHLNWVEVLHKFYNPFKKRLDDAAEQMKHAKAETTPSEYTCPECGEPLEYRFGRNGRFLSCSKYPECKFASPCDIHGKILEDKVTEIECPECGKKMVEKNGRFGKFLGCQDYPQCKTIMKIDKEGNALPPKPPAEPSGIKCHKCKTGELVIRQSKRGPFLGCNKFPRCRNIISMKMFDELKVLQEKGKWPPKTIEEADIMLGRKKAPKKTKKD